MFSDLYDHLIGSANDWHAGTCAGRLEQVL